jgi:hypothetical protein
MFPWIIAASSVCAVAMTINRYNKQGHAAEQRVPIYSATAPQLRRTWIIKHAGVVTIRGYIMLFRRSCKRPGDGTADIG